MKLTEQPTPTLPAREIGQQIQHGARIPGGGANLQSAGTHAIHKPPRWTKRGRLRAELAKCSYATAGSIFSGFTPRSVIACAAFFASNLPSRDSLESAAAAIE